MSPTAVYLILELVSSLLFSFVFTVSQLYQVTVVGLSPLQLVLVGTILEASVFLFEIPTGVLADLRSRRLSVILGYVLIGLGFILEGSVPLFWSVALSQVIWGLGYTFTSGATQAWIADEIGEAQAGGAYLRGAQAAQIGALVAIPASVALGIAGIRLPIILGGMGMILLAAFLAVAMKETGFKPTPAGERTTWALMGNTMRQAHQLVRRQPVLLLLLGIGLFYGLYSEGLDRLWIAHLLEGFALPYIDVVEPVVWFGVIRGVLLVTSLVSVEAARRKVDVNSPAPLARALMLSGALIVVTLAMFGLARSFWVAVVCLWLVDALRSVSEPLYTTWFNLSIDDPRVRATMFSVTGQADALGQIAGGPLVGTIGNASIRAALVVSASLLAPVVPLYAFASRRLKRA
jgi:DHA3 family tetracycline resistance protein-like MFS transporter